MNGLQPFTDRSIKCTGQGLASVGQGKEDAVQRAKEGGRGEAGPPLVLAERARSEGARSTRAVTGRTSLPREKNLLTREKRVRRSIRSVARTERLNRFAPRAMSLRLLRDCD